MDNSFLRLLPTFNEAKQMFDSKQSKFIYYDCISLLPNESYLQITASKVDIVFNGSYKVSVIDACENELKDISERVTIFEFFDKDGIAQIAFEIVNIGESWHYTPVFLKFENTVGAERFYSNAFTVSDENLDETIILNYKSYGYFQGTDYKNANYFQSIRIKSDFQNTEDATETATYTQTSGNVLSLNPTIVFPENFSIDYINNFTFRALAVALKSDIVYLEKYRVTDRPQLKNGERIGNSNLTSCEFTVHRNLDDKTSGSFQLTPILSIIGKTPNGVYNTIGFSTLYITANFNKNIILGVGQFKIFKINGTLVATLTELDFSIVGYNLISNSLISTIVSDFDQYYITFTEGLVTSILNEKISITNNSDWTFELSAGEYEKTEYTDEFLTN
jgi:hypothetical protein